ncbi:EAL and HDOD domain-containing protein [Gayadomonas joobiniege]|uniref:EAL and HDOD domain-containing protein n=1 Tax=Gayadomonas joobiniege TaxID=1234606 RepID=UPI000361AA80|nr:HDOD domain-containing protein [Gayadomonas joobiniege]
MYSYAARQPIFDRNKNVFGYELLFRDSLKNVFPNIDGDVATSKLIETTQFNLGLEELTQNHPALINFSDELVIKEVPTLVPKEQVIIELLETARPTKSLLTAVKKLHQAGYQIALDDYVHTASWLHFFPYINIIKICFKTSSKEQIEHIIEIARNYPIKLLAEKIETYEEFQSAKKLDFDYFQGYFFSEPEMVKKKALAPSTLSLTELLVLASEPELNLKKVCDIFQRDFSLSFKLLRYANSAMFKRRAQIDSIKQALVVLGEQEIKRFLALLFTAQINDDKPTELLNLSITRAKFCESLATEDHSVHAPSVAFLTGMMSVIDALLDQPIESLMEKLPLSDEIKHALTTQEGRLADYLRLIESYEQANWIVTEQLIDKLKLPSNRIPDYYQQAVVWANQQTSSLNGR